MSLVRCTRMDSGNTSRYSSDEQIPYTVSSTFQKNQGQSYEDVWVPIKPSRNISRPPPDASGSQVRTRSESSFVPSTHTVILDFSMVHFVDAQAVVVLRQVGTEVALTSALILTYHHPLSPTLTESY